MELYNNNQNKIIRKYVILNNNELQNLDDNFAKLITACELYNDGHILQKYYKCSQ